MDYYNVDAGNWVQGDTPAGFDWNWYNSGISTLPQVPIVEMENPVVGVNPLVQTFYEGPKKCGCCANWVEKPPTQMPENAKERYDQASVRVYKKKDHESGSSTIGGLVSLKDDTIEIQSQTIIDLIRPILAEVGRLAPDKEKIKFESPFKDLYFAHPKIVQLSRNYHADSNERQHLDVLVEVMEGALSKTSAEVKNLLVRKTISFQYLWTLFPKDIIVYSREDNTDRLYQVVDVKYQDSSDKIPESFWMIECRYFAFDGINFGTRARTWPIYNFNNVQRISSLYVYPVGYHSDLKLEQRLAQRGESVLNFQDLSQCEYNGVAHTAYGPEDDQDVPYHRRVTGRVIIDGLGLKMFNPDEFVAAAELDTSDIKDQDAKAVPQTLPNVSEASTCVLPRIDLNEERRPSPQEQKLNREFFKAHPQYLLVMKPTLAGYSLKLNKWCTTTSSIVVASSDMIIVWFQVDKLRNVLWNSSAFDQLVLPDSRKSLLLTFVEKHEQSSREDVDFITGKGQGLAVLLSGPSGTGKTLTCEAIADRTRRPLYRMQADDLGSKPKEIGHHLAEAFELALFWNAIILLDEADSLLSKRSLESPVRNEIVSVCLRQFEYYRGVILMTTNLLGNIDEAFLSRFHMHLCYKPLSSSLRLSLWKQSLLGLDLSSPHGSGSGNIRLELTSSEWDQLAAWGLNGREIKNAVKNVHLWCQYNAFNITLGKLESTIEVTAPFARKFEDTSEGLQGSRKRPRLEAA